LINQNKNGFELPSLVEIVLTGFCNLQACARLSQKQVNEVERVELFTARKERGNRSRGPLQTAIRRARQLHRQRQTTLAADSKQQL
jgi:hypothetical protein